VRDASLCESVTSECRILQTKELPRGKESKEGKKENESEEEKVILSLGVILGFDASGPVSFGV
jgi:hypothetical protein